MDLARTWSFDWPCSSAATSSLDYMRHAAEENPMTGPPQKLPRWLEPREITET